MDIISTSDYDERMNAIVKSGVPQPSLCFYNAQTKQFQSDIWTELQAGLWKQYLINNRLYNDSIGELSLAEWKPVFPSLYPIYPGIKWDKTLESYIEERYSPNYDFSINLDSFFSIAEDFFSKYTDKKIGVHLSGGLDSSLIICLLHHFGIPCTLIGFTSERFEFRTEQAIQYKLMEYGEYSELINLEQYPFYSKLASTPKHQIPDSYIKQNEASKALARAFAKEGVDVVFTGQGGDSLFTDAIEPKSTSFNIGNEFIFPWEHDLIYSPIGIELVSFFSDKKVIDAICSMRVGQKKDPQKWWVRNTFRKILPIELAEYAYFADFFGLSMSGLEAAKPEIHLLCEEAYDLMQHQIFHPNSVKEILSTDIFSLEHDTYCALCTKISIAVWLHSLFRDDENK